ncbi:hypothetical protein VNO78_18894 [Psophocarpus tetragonolobus]|uniref:Uncharacterized protein n=1 Tax=Psophocarpus tetragonolobus TaxID=3891 RepID=A0AAN9S723_PSOTE
MTFIRVALAPFYPFFFFDLFPVHLGNFGLTNWYVGTVAVLVRMLFLAIDNAMHSDVGEWRGKSPCRCTKIMRNVMLKVYSLSHY